MCTYHFSYCLVILSYRVNPISKIKTNYFLDHHLSIIGGRLSLKCSYFFLLIHVLLFLAVIALMCFPWFLCIYDLMKYAVLESTLFWFELLETWLYKKVCHLGVLVGCEWGGGVDAFPKNIWCHLTTQTNQFKLYILSVSYKKKKNDGICVKLNVFDFSYS